MVCLVITGEQEGGVKQAESRRELERSVIVRRLKDQVCTL
jgi:hypothetical protein